MKKFIIQYRPDYSLEKMFSHFDQAITGKKHLQPKNVVVFSDLTTIYQVISQARINLLNCLVEKQPENIYQLAKLLGRDYANVWRDCQALNSLGVIKLKKIGAETKPIACYEGIAVEFPLISQENKLILLRNELFSPLKPVSEQEQIKIHRLIKT